MTLREVKSMEEKQKKVYKHTTASPAHTKAATKYNATHTKLVAIRFNNKSDEDILGKLATVDSVAGYIKQLIREDIEKGQK